MCVCVSASEPPSEALFANRQTLTSILSHAFGPITEDVRVHNGVTSAGSFGSAN